MSLDAVQILKNCYDPVSRAIRVLQDIESISASIGMDAETIIKRCYDPINLALRMAVIGTPSGSYGTPLDWRQIIKYIFADATFIRTVETS